METGFEFLRKLSSRELLDARDHALGYVEDDIANDGDLDFIDAVNEELKIRQNKGVSCV